ncbi:MAG: heme-binding protein [Pseudomonadota bacterium]
MAARARKGMMIAGYIGGAIVLIGIAYVGFFVYLSASVERPKYALIEQDGAIEIREYPALVVAEVVKTGGRRDAVRAGFRPLAGYIFAKERSGERISMTAPVTQQRTEAGDSDGWAVRFIMPSALDLAALPKPANAEVRLLQKPKARYAAIRFSGAADDALIADKEAEIRTWLSRRKLESDGSPIYAYYNDPRVPGFLRRNEVLLEIKSGDAD